MKLTRPFFVLLLLALLAPLTAQETAAPAADSGRIVREEWMIALMQGKRCGFGSAILRERNTPAGKQYITDLSLEFKLSRQGQEIHLISRSSTVETEAGVVVSFQSETRGAGSDQVARGYRVGEEMVILGGDQKRRVPMPRDTLGPEAFDRKFRELKMAPGVNFSAPAFLTDFAQAPVTMTVRVIGREARDVRGKPLDLWKTVTTMSVMPGLDTTSFINDQFRAELVILPFPGVGDFQLVTTTRADAMKQIESIEIFANSLVTPRQPLRNIATLKSATLRLTLKSSTDPLALWSGGEQQVIETKPGMATVRITVPDIDEKTATWQLPHAAEPDLKPYLDSSFYVEQTPRLQALARQAVGDEKNPVLAAHKIEAFVRDYIQRKDLSVGFATADETAVSRAGDCTEHAVLCAALARAVGLPARLVVGLGYLSGDGTGTFGFHMWAEAWIAPEKWLAMDAALRGFDVGHIAIAKTALQEVNPLAELTMPVLNLMQNLQIDVIEPQP